MSDSRTNELTRKVLQAIGSRPTGAGFERPSIDGFTRAEVDACVDELRRGGYVVAAHIEKGFGDNPEHWAPSELTVRGRHLLEEIPRR